ncbi:SETMR methyltransferase, partial [Pseudoatta argentina]
AILLQKNDEDNLLHSIYYTNWKTTEAEECYTSYKLEVLAVIKSLRKFRMYLLDISFRIITVLEIEEFHKVEHRPGTLIRHADALNRNPMEYFTSDIQKPQDPQMKHKVQQVINNCVHCLLIQKKSGKAEGLLQPLDKGDLPLETVNEVISSKISRVILQNSFKSFTQCWIQKEVPHELSVKNMIDRINICDTLLKRNEIEPFLKRITGDEIRITYDNRTLKRSWIKEGKKAQAKPGLTKKVMLCVCGGIERESFTMLLSNN